MNKKTMFLSKEEIIEMTSAFRKSRILLTAIELDLFTLIADNPMDVRQITLQLNTDLRATDKLLKSLHQIGFIDQENGKYKNTEHSYRFLNKNSPEYIDEINEYFEIWDHWNDLTNSIFTGHLNRKQSKYRLVYNKVPQQVLSEYTKPENMNVLELGTKLSISSKKYINNNDKQLKIKAFDSPERIEAILSSIGTSSHLNDIEFVKGEFSQLEFGTNYDLVLASNFLERYSVHENISILKKVFSSLRPQGKFIIHEYLERDDKTHSKENLLHSINLLLKTQNGDLYTQADINVMLNEAGFKNIHRENVSDDEAIFTAIK